MTQRSTSPAGPGLPFSPSLAPFGGSPSLLASFAPPPGQEPGRIVAASRGLVLVRAASGETWAEPTGRLRERLHQEDLALCTGDWVHLQPNPGPSRATVTALMPRGAALVRQGSGGRPQCLAANLDRVFAVMGLDRNFNPARMERLLALAWGSGAQPVAVLTKRDLVPEWEALARRIEALAPGVPVLALSARTGEGLAELQAQLPPGLTAVLVGSSGAGKSTLLNALAGQDLRRTQEVRASDGRGRHTTTLRELFPLPWGACLVDTPGIRAVGLGSEGADVDTTFADVSALAERCRFRDCAHGAEPGCAVRAALEEGSLPRDRYDHFLRLRREVAYAEARSDAQAWREREEKWHRISKLQKAMRKR